MPSIFIYRLYQFLGLREEFVRAGKVYRSDLTKGIPARFLPDLRLELIDILGWIGVNPSHTPRYAALLIRGNPDDVVVTVLAVMCAVSEEILPTLHRNRVLSPIPSDAALGRWLAFLGGVMLWVALQIQSLVVYERVHKLFQRTWVFYYETEGEEKGQSIQWSLFVKRRNYKSLRLDALLAGSSRVLRTLTRLSNGSTAGIDWGKLDRSIRGTYTGLSEGKILSETGCLDLLLDDYNEAREDPTFDPENREEEGNQGD